MHDALVRERFAHVAWVAPPGVLRGRAPGNVVLLASAVPLPLVALRRAAAAAVPREQVLRAMNKKQLALVAAIMGSFVAGLDSTVVNVALPSIRDDLGGGLAGQQWVSNAYLLTLGLADPRRGLAGRPLRRAADLLDRRRRVRRRLACCARWRRRSRCWSPAARCRASSARC